MNNLFQNLPDTNEEVIEVLHHSDAMKIERIASNGQPSPLDFWYDQEQDEWVMLAQGTATLEFNNGEQKKMNAGDYLLIPSHRKHRVSEVSRDAIWLAVHCQKSIATFPQ